MRPSKSGFDKPRYNFREPITTINMSVDDWIKIERNPHQRKECLRVNKPHLKVLKLPHWVVYMGILPNGDSYKIDGHTRAYKWLKGTLERPPFVIAVVISANTIDEIEAIYQCYDSRLAVKSRPDDMQSGANACGIKFKTPWLKAGKFSGILTEVCAFARVDKSVLPIERVTKFKKELELLDRVTNLRPLSLGYGAGLVMALRKHGDKILPFIQLVSDGVGIHVGKQRDPVRFLLDQWKSDRDAKTMAGRQNNHRQMAYTLGCVERWLESGDKLFVHRPTQIDLANYLPTHTIRRRGRPPKGIEAGLYPHA
jgi:hypothetical protein